jgi:hypothetical protein
MKKPPQKIKRLKTPEELKASTDKINAVIDKAKQDKAAAEEQLNRHPDKAIINEKAQDNHQPATESDQRVAIEEESPVIAGLNQESEGAAEGQITFKTSKGSTYQVHEDGTTTRNKSFHAEHGGDEGVKPRSQRTVYVDKNEVSKLSLVQTKGWKEGEYPYMTFDEPSSQIAVGVNKNGKKTYDKDSVVKFSTEPEVGKIPVEIWEDGKGVHFGNEITEVNQENKGTKQQSQPTAKENEVTNGTTHTVSPISTDTTIQPEAAAPQGQENQSTVSGHPEPTGQGDASPADAVLDDKAFSEAAHAHHQYTGQAHLFHP